MPSSLNRRLSELSPEKRALLESWLQKGGAAAGDRQQVPRRDPSQPCPLSFGQQRLWFLDQLQPGLTVFNEYSVFRITGNLKTDALRQSLNEITRRHEACRTTFAFEAEHPIQVVNNPRDFDLAVHDLSHLPPAERSSEIDRHIGEEGRHVFDLKRDPMWRATLLQCGPQEHVFIVTRHHIASDGWSLGIFWNELAALYQSHVDDQPASLSELPIQYADYAVWQRQWLDSAAARSHRDEWQRQLDGAPPLLELPTDYPRPAVESHQGAKHNLAFSKSLTDRLRRWASGRNSTLYMALLTGFKMLLYRYSGQTDLVVGSPVAGRAQPETMALIGCFINNLALRTRLTDEMTANELLACVRETTLNALAWQDVPFEAVVELVQPERALSQSPLFQVILNLDNTPEKTYRLSGLEVERIPADNGTAKLDIVISLMEFPDGLRGSCEYNTDLFDTGTIERMMRHFERLLEGIVANPDQPLGTLALLDEAERHQVLVEWNDSAAHYPKDLCIPQLFEAQVERAPDAVAVSFEGGQLSYRELNARANQLAHHLRKLGVGPETLVGTCLERSVENVIAVLGILKAGGAYVPLDPTYPKDRLAFMLEDTQMPVLLTQQSITAALPETRATVVCLDTQSAEIAAESRDNPTTNVTPDNLAYVIYTSGSTGQPKGVEVTHSAINGLVSNTNYVRLEATDRVAHVSNVSFDVVTYEIWGPLLSGARMVLVAREVLLSPKDFAAQLEADGITTLFMTAALFNLVARDVPSAFHSIKHLLVGGEAVTPHWMREVLKHGPPERLLNAYGPTESTTFASWHLVREVSEDAVNVPIGRPISNTRLYLLDRHLNPVPVGVTAELHIAGDGLARGYHNRPELTAEKFIQWNGVDLTPQQAASNDTEKPKDCPAQRLYRSGDLARWRADGNIEFLARVDEQVKVRGFRIEPGEIETVLRQHEDVNEVVVIVREDTPGDKRLTAYCVPQPGHTPHASDLRVYLKDKLPDYMIPSAFVMLETLPRTVNGKLDRCGLPKPDASAESEANDSPVSRTPVEEALAEIWEEVLGLKRVGVTDNFFELGGHSLMATQVISRIRHRFHVDLRVMAVFEEPTIAEMALLITQVQALQADPAAVELLLAELETSEASPQTDPLQGPSDRN
jgi:amino acid adenylation domain-containing protein